MDLPSEFANLRAYTNYSATQEEVIPFSNATHSMAIRAEVHKTPCQVLLDSGATGTGFVSQLFCAQHKIIQYPTKKTSVSLGDNTRITSSMAAQVPLQIGTLRIRTECLVLPDIPQFPVVLGTPWLQANKVKMDFDNMSVTLQKHHKRETISLTPPCTALNQLSTTQPTEGEGVPFDWTPPVISPKKVRKWVKTNQLSELYLVTLSAADTDSDLDQIAQEFTSELDVTIPGSSLHENSMKHLLYKNRDLFRKALPGPSFLPNEREVICNEYDSWRWKCQKGARA